MGDRDAVESVAGITWNTQTSTTVSANHASDVNLLRLKAIQRPDFDEMFQLKQ
jgi:hypothetical protein